MIERRQALIEAALAGQKIDAQLVAAAVTGGRLVQDGPLARVERRNFNKPRSPRRPWTFAIR